MPQHYRLHGLCLRAVSDHPAVRQLLDRALRYKGAEATSGAESTDVTLDFGVDRDRSPRPEAARHVNTGEHFGIDLWKTADRVLLRHDEATVDLRPETGAAEAAVAPDLLDGDSGQPGRSLLPYLVAFSLAILLRVRGWFPLHAAGLVRGGRGLLVTGRSGSGKSTAALSLVRNGWAYLSDDTVLLRPEGDRVEAHSFRRSFCVDPNIATHFPELEGPDWPRALSNAAKWEVDPDQVYPGQYTATCTPRLVVLPDLVDAPESRVEPAAPKPVLEQLLNQGGFFLAPGPDTADQHLTALRRLIDQARTYRLHAGRDVLEEPRTLHRLLAPLLEEEPASGTA